MASPGADTDPPSGAGHDHLRQLTPLLVWAVVFCDIGTSVYYVPGILNSNPQVGSLYRNLGGFHFKEVTRLLAADSAEVIPAPAATYREPVTRASAAPITSCN